MKNVYFALKKLFEQKQYIIVFLLVFLVSIALYTYLLLKNVTWDLLWKMNSPYYNVLQISLNIAISLLLGMAISMLVYIVRNKKKGEGLTTLGAITSILFSAATTGCYVCGALLLPTVGITASLKALPFGGLEVKILSLGILYYSIFEYSKSILGLCKVNHAKFLLLQKGKIIVTFSKEAFLNLKPLFLIAGFLILIYLLPFVPDKYKLNFRNSSVPANSYACPASV